MIKAIIFDFWNTLFFSGPPRPLEVFSRKIGQSMDDYSYVKILEKHLMLHRHEDIEKVIGTLLNELRIKPS
ncbi:MAG: hypothetical protein ABIJ92_00210 [Candidatus Aenigmatarchaeota archaeon]